MRLKVTASQPQHVTTRNERNAHDLIVIALAIAIPGIAYAMLDSNQKARLKAIRSRKQIGR